MTILTVRLETAGETMIFYKLTLGEVDTTIPAIGLMPRALRTAAVTPARRLQRGDVEWSTRTLSSTRSSLKDVSQFQGCVDMTSSVATRNSTIKYTVGCDTECTTSIYNELDETVTTKCTEAATLTSEGWYLFRSGRTTRRARFDRGVCWR